jgi:hypothetical protein
MVRLGVGGVELGRGDGIGGLGARFGCVVDLEEGGCGRGWDLAEDFGIVEVVETDFGIAGVEVVEKDSGIVDVEVVEMDCRIRGAEFPTR